jgi:predicted dehydrogenase
MSALYNRRSFLKTSVLAAAGAATLSHRAFAQSRGANDKIVLGLIGVGIMGRDNLRQLLKLPNVECAVICDVDRAHAERAVGEVLKLQTRQPEICGDFRRVLDRKDIDAVVISTPDHWHAIPFIAACEAGKDIYCEKPISHSFVEAKAMAAAARHFKRVVQVGTWQRSVPHFQQAVEFIRAGKLGRVQVCRAWATHTPKPVGHHQPTVPPAELDWDFWLGPAPKHPYQVNRCHYLWRWFYETGGGLIADWGVHMIDIALLAMNDWDPISVHSEGGIYATDDDRDTPDTLQVIYRFPKWQLLWEHRHGNNQGLDTQGKDAGVSFVGDKGTLMVDRSAVRWFPLDTDEEVEGPGESRRGENTHWQNFADCIRSREVPRADIASLARTTMMCHLGNISYQSGATVRWDAATQDIANRAARQTMAYERDYRKPWKLRHYKA